MKLQHKKAENTLFFFILPVMQGFSSFRPGKPGETGKNPRKSRAGQNRKVGISRLFEFPARLFLLQNATNATAKPGKKRARAGSRTCGQARALSRHPRPRRCSPGPAHPFRPRAGILSGSRRYRYRAGLLPMEAPRPRAMHRARSAGLLSGSLHDGHQGGNKAGELPRMFRTGPGPITVAFRFIFFSCLAIM